MQQQLESIIVRCTEFLKDNGFSSQANQMRCNSLGISVCLQKAWWWHSSPQLLVYEFHRERESPSPTSTCPPPKRHSQVSRAVAAFSSLSGVSRPSIRSGRRTLHGECTVATTLLKVRGWWRRGGKVASKMLNGQWQHGDSNTLSL